jgi:AcrR family transcriptional regulator
MGRKPLTFERQALILDATERCIAKYGLQGTTLENIADEAGINRGLIHHYVGNRNDVVQKMLERLLGRYHESFKTYASMRPESTHAEIVMDYYFDAWFELAPEDDAILLSLVSESQRDLQIQKDLQKLYDSFEQLIAQELRLFFPSVGTKKLHSVSYALMLLAFSHATMIWMGLPKAGKADVRSTAATLIATLK